MSPLKPDEDENFGGSLVLDLRKWWRHVKTIYLHFWVFQKGEIARAASASEISLFEKLKSAN